MAATRGPRATTHDNVTELPDGAADATGAPGAKTLPFPTHARHFPVPNSRGVLTVRQPPGQ